MKKVLSIVLALCMVMQAGAVFAEEYTTVGDFTYIFKNDVAYLTSYNGGGEVALIEPVVNGCKVKTISKGTFDNCESVKKVVIPDGVTTIEQGAFVSCPKLEEIIISDTVTYMVEGSFDLCRSLKKVVIGKGMENIPRMAFSHCSIEKLVILNKETKINSRVWHSVNMHGAMREYWLLDSFNSCIIGEICAPTGSGAEKYAKENGIPFSPVDESEYEEQKEHADIVPESRLIELVTRISEDNGGIVTRSGESIAVQRMGRILAITNGTVYYMDNGVLVTESLYYSESYVKMPHKALKSVLGEYVVKSDKYYEIMKRFEEGPIIKSIETWETPYGTLVYYAAVGVMHGTGSCLELVRWDGTELGIVGGNAPKLNQFQNAPWSDVQISEDGRRVKVIYKSNSWLTIDGEIEADLVTGEVSPYKSFLSFPQRENNSSSADMPSEREEWARVIEKDGMKVSASVITEPQNGPINLFDENFVSYCVLYVDNEEEPEYIEFDLGEVKNVSKLALAFRNATSRTTYFDVRVSCDGNGFETVIEKSGSKGDTDALQYFNINRDARYVRVYGYSNSFNRYWVSITEARVFAN